MEPESGLQERLQHLRSNESAALVTLVKRLHERYGDDLLHVVLFGSKARGDSDAESDVDVLIVLRMPSSEYRRHWHEIVDVASEIELACNVVFTLIIKDQVGYERMQKARLLLARNIEREGIELWAK